MLFIITFIHDIYLNIIEFNVLDSNFQRESKRIDDIEVPRINNHYPYKVVDQQNMVKIMGAIYNGEADHVNEGRGFVGIDVVKSRTILSLIT